MDNSLIKGRPFSDKVLQAPVLTDVMEIITLWEDYLYTPTLDFNMNHPEYADMRDDEIVDKLKAKYGVKN